VSLYVPPKRRGPSELHDRTNHSRCCENLPSCLLAPARPVAHSCAYGLLWASRTVGSRVWRVAATCPVHTPAALTLPDSETAIRRSVQ
jgi:hypothetical protein